MAHRDYLYLPERSNRTTRALVSHSRMESGVEPAGLP
jgi:hypothetical protein